jgi:RES domain-containing protein
LRTTAWRVVKREFAANAFDGEGARLYGGRWHSSGRAVVYTSATTSLGLLEQLVHSAKRLRPFYRTIPVTFDTDLVETIDASRLPSGWTGYPPPFELQQIGNEWVDSMRSCILEVPSVIVPHESNFILNPGQPEFASLKIGESIGLDLDSRLV